ncbi:MAG: hypothetical protein EZS28_034580, partial [Streblomastix strix]
MTSSYTKNQLIDVGELFGVNLRWYSNKIGRNNLSALFINYEVKKPHGYSADLKNRVKAAVKQRQKEIKQQNQRLEKQRLEEVQKQNAQRRRREEEARENFENLHQFVQRKDFNNLQQQRELQEYKDEYQRRMFAEEARENFENLRQFVQRNDFNNLQQQRELQEYKEEFQRNEREADYRNNFDNLRQFLQHDDYHNPQSQRELQEFKEEQLRNERYQRIHDEFNNLSDLELRTFRLLDEEIAEEIRKLDYKNFREIDFEDADALMLTEPFNQVLFRRQVKSFRQKYPKETVEKMYSKKQSDNFEPTRHYYNNHITNQEDIENHIRKVGQLELQMNSFKISFDFGYIVETVRYDEDGIQEVSYDIRYPHNNILNALNPESLIDSQEKLEKFIQYLPAKIIENQERTVEDTHTRFVAIVSMVVVVYRNRAGGAAPAELQKFIKRQEVKFVDNKNYRNNCLFDALSFISLPDEQEKRKSNCNRVAEGKRLMKQFYSAIGNESVKNFTEFLENYQGFDLASEGKQLANIFNINICFYAYHHLDFDEKPSSTVAEKQINSKGTNSVGTDKVSARVHRKKQDNIKDEKFDNYFLDFVIKPNEATKSLNTACEHNVKCKLLEIQTENMIKTILPHADDDSFVFEAIGEKLKDCLDKLGDPAKAQEIKQRLINEDAMKLQNSFNKYKQKSIRDRISHAHVPLYHYEKADKRLDYCKKDENELTYEEKQSRKKYEQIYKERTVHRLYLDNDE